MIKAKKIIVILEDINNEEHTIEFTDFINQRNFDVVITDNSKKDYYKGIIAVIKNDYNININLDCNSYTVEQKEKSKYENKI